ncbi:MAG: hypothetical protein VB035_03830 [Candidatus Fimivivens sp.]|nr:hypothetical protein [Candidatus Fimivivens sp.]
MIKTIKKISYGLMALFLAAVIFLLIAIKYNWDVGRGFVPVFVVLLILTLLFATVVAGVKIVQFIRKDPKKFAVAFFKRWAFFFLAAFAAAVFKKNVDMLMLLGMTMASAVLSFGYASNENKS